MSYHRGLGGAGSMLLTSTGIKITPIPEEAGLSALQRMQCGLEKTQPLYEACVKNAVVAQQQASLIAGAVKGPAQVIAVGVLGAGLLTTALSSGTAGKVVGICLIGLGGFFTYNTVVK